MQSWSPGIAVENVALFHPYGFALLYFWDDLAAVAKIYVVEKRFQLASTRDRDRNSSANLVASDRHHARHSSCSSDCSCVRSDHFSLTETDLSRAARSCDRGPAIWTRSRPYRGDQCPNWSRTLERNDAERVRCIAFITIMNLQNNALYAMMPA